MKNLRIYLFFVFTLTGLISVLAQVDRQKELEEQRQSVLNEIKQINSLLFKTRGKKKSVLTEVEDLSHRIDARENLIKVTNRQANYLTREISSNLDRMDQLRGELKVLKEDYAGMIKRSYRSKSQQSRVMFLMSSENFLQAYKRLQYMKQYAKHRKKQGKSIKEKTALLQVLNADLITQNKQKKLLISENKTAKEQLLKEKNNQEVLVASLKKDESKFATQIRTKQKEANAIDREIDAIIKAAIAASNKNNTSSSNTVSTVETFALTPESKAIAANFSSNKGRLLWPVEKGVVTRRYGNKRHPQLPNITTFSSGAEITTEANAYARAVFEGEVFQIQQIRGTNQAVYIRHGNFITVYHNLHDLSVKKGDKVTNKQNIGKVFTNPISKKTVLKFLVYRDSKRQNPADWIYKM
jgi:septal ring factor EnvC (AmiA/AmiB activator)